MIPHGIIAYNLVYTKVKREREGKNHSYSEHLQCYSVTLRALCRANAVIDVRFHRCGWPVDIKHGILATSRIGDINIKGGAGRIENIYV